MICDGAIFAAQSVEDFFRGDEINVGCIYDRELVVVETKDEVDVISGFRRFTLNSVKLHFVGDELCKQYPKCVVVFGNVRVAFQKGVFAEAKMIAKECVPGVLGENL